MKGVKQQVKNLKIVAVHYKKNIAEKNTINSKAAPINKFLLLLKK